MHYNILSVRILWVSLCVTCLCLSRIEPKNLYVSGNPWDLAHSRTLTTRCCSGCNTRPWNKQHLYIYILYSRINNSLFLFLIVVMDVFLEELSILTDYNWVDQAFTSVMFFFFPELETQLIGTFKLNGLYPATIKQCLLKSTYSNIYWNLACNQQSMLLEKLKFTL